MFQGSLGMYLYIYTMYLLYFYIVRGFLYILKLQRRRRVEYRL